MRIEIELRERAREKWHKDPRVSLVAAEIWRRLERIAAGETRVSFAGRAGSETIFLPQGIGVVMSCVWLGHNKLVVYDIRVYVS